MWDVLATGNDFACTIVFFLSSTVRISVFERSPVGHDLILPSVCARRAYPRRFLGRVGRRPLSPTLTRRRFQMSSRKRVKNCLYSTDAYQCGNRLSFWEPPRIEPIHDAPLNYLRGIICEHPCEVDEVAYVGISQIGITDFVRNVGAFKCTW